MFKIHHGCAMAYQDGTRIPITEKCICGTDKPFRKPTVDIQNRVDTRSLLRKKKKCTWKYMDSYYNKKERLQC